MTVMLKSPPRHLADPGEPRRVATVALWVVLCSVLVALGWVSVSVVASLIGLSPSDLDPSGPAEQVPPLPLSFIPAGEGSTSTTASVSATTTSNPASVEEGSISSPLGADRDADGGRPQTPAVRQPATVQPTAPPTTASTATSPKRMKGTAGRQGEVAGSLDGPGRAPRREKTSGQERGGRPAVP
jgi:hypothetical protein